ncbi:MAG: hypothetical protein IJN64_14200 [Lachnospiraceae bacterium]|nr:hypothetical protein [Lachnospiraceae bacterium]
MSTIMGIKTNNIVILGADKRVSTYEGKVISDDSDKILVINNHLAMACAGNAAIQKAIEIDTEKLEKTMNSLYVEDAIDVICNLFKKLEDAKAKTILSHTSYVIVGGLNQNKEIKLLAFSYVHGKLQWSEVKEDKIIFPPTDVSMQRCAEIFVENYRLHTENMIEKTVADISAISNVVSECGNKWIYDNRTKLSEKRDFDYLV